ncbi:hypothetical protein L210DRAFT_2859487 [Boletus edulis BED1]|uniref:Uncharacterized protein n=1 Tax=Boletus edulis BED1 TaxID=1328754 RepID=A0AAD4B9U0_BOLED|nr:hypothetical protein L210DRAFT_2859487 [Boletus edulis BED1]
MKSSDERSMAPSLPVSPPSTVAPLILAVFAPTTPHPCSVPTSATRRFPILGPRARARKLLSCSLLRGGPHTTHFRPDRCRLPSWARKRYVLPPTPLPSSHTSHYMYCLPCCTCNHIDRSSPHQAISEDGDHSFREVFVG